MKNKCFVNFFRHFMNSSALKEEGGWKGENEKSIRKIRFPSYLIFNLDKNNYADCE